MIKQRWMFYKMPKQRKENIFKERSYNCSFIQSAFFFEKLSRDMHR